MIAAVFYNSLAITPNPCQEPLTYRIATIDSRYRIDENQLHKIMLEVANLWDSALNRPLLKYDPKGDVAIHLIFSENQKETKAQQKLSRKIESQKQQFDILEQEYQRLSQKYEKQQSAFKKLFSDYNSQIKSLNNTFAELKKEGISANEKRVIKREERQIKNLKYKVDQRHEELESLRKRLNQKARWLNKRSAEINQLITAYNDQFSKPRSFHQGRYIKKGNRQMVKIFQFGNNFALKTVLAHEMGHALGLNHVENPESVMYYLLEKQNMVDLKLSEQDIAAIKNHCSE